MHISSVENFINNFVATFSSTCSNNLAVIFPLRSQPRAAPSCSLPPLPNICHANNEHIELPASAPTQSYCHNGFERVCPCILHGSGDGMPLLTEFARLHAQEINNCISGQKFINTNWSKWSMNADILLLRRSWLHPSSERAQCTLHLQPVFDFLTTQFIKLIFFLIN